MGVKQKTPTPFVGAGSVKTVTPNLTGPWTAIAEGADQILNRRLDDRKDKAIEQGELDSWGLITYDDDGNLNPISNLPKDNTFYSQSLRQNASLKFYNSLENDLKNFTTKTLMTYPNNPELVQEEFNTYRENAVEDLDENLVGATNEILKRYTNEAILTSQGNVVKKNITDARLNASETIDTVTENIISRAMLNNADPTHDQVMRLNDAYELLIATDDGKENGYNKVRKETEFNDLLRTVQVNKAMFPMQEHFKTMSLPLGEFDIDETQKARNIVDIYFTKTLEKIPDLKTKEEFTKLYNQGLEAAEKAVKNKIAIINAKNAEIYKNTEIELRTLINNNEINSLEFMNNSRGIQDYLSKGIIDWKTLKPIVESYHTINNKNKEDSQKIISENSMYAWKNGMMEYEELIKNSYIAKSPEYVKQINAHKTQTLKDSIAENQKIGKKYMMSSVLTLIESFPKIADIEGTPFFYGNDFYDSVKVEEYLLENKIVDIDDWNHIDHNKAATLEKISKAYKQYVSNLNAKQKLTDAIEDSKNNSTPLSNENQTKYYKNNGIRFNLQSEGLDGDPYEFFVKHNLNHNTIHGPLEGGLTAPWTLNADDANKFLPLIESAFISSKEGYKKDHNILLTEKMPEASQLFWREYIDGLAVGLDSNQSFKDAQKNYKANNSALSKDKRENLDSAWNTWFTAHPNVELDEDLNTNSTFFGFKIGIQELASGLQGFNNVLGMKDFGQDYGINQGMMATVKDANGKDVSLYDHTNDNDKAKWMKTLWETYSDKHEGIASYLLDKLDGVTQSFGLGTWGFSELNDPAVRRMVDNFGDLVSIANTPPPLAVREEALRRAKKIFNLNQDVYRNNPERRDELLFHQMINVLAEQNYVPEITTADGILSTKSQEGYKSRWTKNSILMSAQKSGWKDVNIQWTPQIANIEIALMMGNKNWNQDPNNPEQFQIKPEDLGVKNFHDVKWVLKTNGKNEDGSAIAEIYYYTPGDEQVKPLRAKVYEDGVLTPYEAPVQYPYEYENSFYKAIYEDQAGKIREIIAKHPKILDNDGVDLVSKFYLNGFNFLGLQKPENKLIMGAIYNTYKDQDIWNGYFNNKKQYDESENTDYNGYEILKKPNPKLKE